MAKEYIDREALEQFMASHKIRGDCKFCRNYEICVAQGLNRRGSHLYCWQEIILPAADVAEVRHGEWLVNTQCNHKPCRMKNPEKWHTYKCSKCGYSNGRRKSNYCPNCGAKMDGKDGAENG